MRVYLAPILTNLTRPILLNTPCWYYNRQRLDVSIRHLILLAHLFTIIAIRPGPGGARAVIADSLLMKQQLLVVNRSRPRPPNLSALDRFLFGFCSLFLSTPDPSCCRNYSAIDTIEIASRNGVHTRWSLYRIRDFEPPGYGIGNYWIISPMIFTCNH